MIIQKRIWLFLIFGGLLSSLLIACQTAPEPTPTPVPPTPTAEPTPEPTATPSAEIEGWTLVWQDEFDGDEIDLTKWTHEVNGRGGGNAELQYYTDDPKNSRVENGFLIIEAHEERHLGKNYTSARINTRDQFEHAYGRYEARIKIPRGQGMWPAFWMLGANLDRSSWPHVGEIDIMENVGFEPAVVHGTVHGPGYSGGDGVGAPHRLRGSTPYADDFHIFAVEWEPEEIRWYVDGYHYSTIVPAAVSGEWVFDHEFFMILNLAVGGNWPGSPDETTQFPQQMLVDYVRVYDKAE